MSHRDIRLVPLLDAFRRLTKVDTKISTRLDMLRDGTVAAFFRRDDIDEIYFLCPPSFFKDKKNDDLYVRRRASGLAQGVQLASLLPYIYPLMLEVDGFLEKRNFKSLVDCDFLRFWIQNFEEPSNDRAWNELSTKWQATKRNLIVHAEWDVDLYGSISDLDQVLTDKSKAKKESVPRNKRAASDEFWLALIRFIEIKQFGNKKDAVNRYLIDLSNSKDNKIDVSESYIKQMLDIVWSESNLRINKKI